MHEKRRRSCRGERRRHLLPDMPRLADSGDDDTALGSREQRHCRIERQSHAVAEHGPQRREPEFLELQRPDGRRSCRAPLL